MKNSGRAAPIRLSDRFDGPKGVDGIAIDRPSTWQKYHSGDCKGCWGGCCTLPVEVSAFDLMRLGVATEDEAASSQKKLAKRLIKEGVLQRYHPTTGLFVLEQRGRDCIYLGKDRLCTVYEKRPEVCRQFPKIGPRPGFCPKQRK
ncbi:MAG: YkgJ family cysteine cluster protein [Bdellovibrionales bacterium]|nr:YkgJ family cysteine cluster protein [Bdellovibrionales bacterium]